MKSMQLTWLLLAVSLSLGSAAHARGPSWNNTAGTHASAGAGSYAAMGSGQGGGKRAGADQAQSGAGNGTRAQVHTPGTGMSDADPSTGQSRGANATHGLHAPGTGLTSATTN